MTPKYNSSLDVMDRNALPSMTSINGDDDENSNNSDNEADHDDCISCAYCRLVGGDAEMMLIMMMMMIMLIMMIVSWCRLVGGDAAGGPFDPLTSVIATKPPTHPLSPPALSSRKYKYKYKHSLPPHHQTLKYQIQIQTIKKEQT